MRCLHNPIHPNSQPFLRFAIDDQHFQFVALPFRLCIAPRVFTKILAQWQQGIYVLPYLDDLLLKAVLQIQEAKDTEITLITITEF